MKKELAEKGQLKTVIDKSDSLDQVKDAYHYALSGQKTGSLVLRIP